MQKSVVLRMQETIQLNRTTSYPSLPIWKIVMRCYHLPQMMFEILAAELLKYLMGEQGI